jgi:hypothetical protein
MVVANIFHRGRFFVARIPRDAVREVLLQLEHFPPEAIAAHTQIRFLFSEAVELIPQTGAPDSGERVYVNDLTLSIEAAAPRGVPYNLIKGMRPYFMTAYRITTAATEHHEVVVTQKRRVSQHRIDLTPVEMRRLLEHAIETATNLGYTRVYNTLTASCTTEAMRLIDESLSGGVVSFGAFDRFNRWAFSRMPVLGPWALKLRLIYGGELPLFNEEPAPWVQESQSR